MDTGRAKAARDLMAADGSKALFTSPVPSNVLGRFG